VSGAFVCHADFALERKYDDLFVELGQLQNDLTEALSIEPAHEQVELYLFETEFAYRNFLQARLPQVPYRRALFVKGRGSGKVFAYKSKALPVDVRHEGTHGLLQVPAASRAYDNPYMTRVKAEVRSPLEFEMVRKTKIPIGRVQKLAQLEAKRDVSEMDATDYRHAWAWAHFLIHGPPEAHDELVKYFSDIQRSTPPGQLSERLEQRLPGLDKRLAQHFKTWKR